MATFRAHKVVAALPATLEPNAIYAVRIGTGFDLYLSDDSGLLAMKVNGPVSWMDLVPRPSVEVGAAIVSGQAGTVRKHTKDGEADIFRFIPTDYDPALDGFYSTYSAGALSGLITTRG